MTINWDATPFFEPMAISVDRKFRVKAEPRLIVLMNSSNLMMRKSLRLAKTPGG